ncbi:P-loop containing nucleoside triphosphate hydrolase protein [Rhizoclosmatium globosum]|uniref:p-loop containing nucleoside triphosphate hydrolase protein n=1 Tax=Rhizoclosmatium globosum TaxID=329046 RepID=A0A1Y2D3R4_9FUNG|nr:P-loop containing nucleoside triphosphate hydrolase protein [Rhizoclosmatium globosum]|eukprot:ORY53746.1 P-loop containing nucleoside triphosphate hydrolase protein [Rhizoclosmatium globosum]
MTTANTAIQVNTGIKPQGLTLTWKELGYSVTNSKTKENSFILKEISGTLQPGEILADVIAGRKGKSGTVHGSVFLDGQERPIKKYASYVTQDDSLIGSFTVRETIRWAVKLNLPTLPFPTQEAKVQDMLLQFGLTKCADSVVGDVLRRGISGGEKRRLSIAVQLVKESKVVFLDEPTSGLDSAASFKVMESIKNLAAKRQCAVVCSIHQPSPSTYQLFDKVLFLARGETIYFGPNNGEEVDYFEAIGHAIPEHVNVPDAVLDSINVDFLGDEELAKSRMDKFVANWKSSTNFASAKQAVDQDLSKHKARDPSPGKVILGSNDYAQPFWNQVAILTHRNFSNAIKNILMFWVRLVLYVAMAVLMGTTWWQMGNAQNSVQSRINAFFLSVGFLAFMSVAGVPAILEDRQVFYRERMNRTYSVGAYVLANTIVSIPFIYILALGFSLPAYLFMGLQLSASKFFIYTSFMWFTLYVAESVTVFIAALFPIFVIALTLAALFNGLEMVTHGALVRENLPSFWRYGFHYWNYQRITFECAQLPKGGCFCSVPSSLGDDACTFSGDDVLKEYGYSEYSYYKSVACLVALIVFFL